MHIRSLLGSALLSAAACLAAPAPVLAQEVLRMAFADPIEGIDVIYDPKPEQDFTDTAVFDHLARYDPDTHEYVGVLAESFEQVDDLTWRVVLKEGIRWHDGEPFDAGDVAYTMNFYVDPAMRFPSKARFDFIEKAEVVDPRTVMVHLNRPYTPILARFATGMPIYPEHLHGKLADKSTWGRNPVGTGPYRATTVDSETGIVLERNEDYAAGPKPDFDRIEIRPIPDPQSQVAELMTGGLDIVMVPDAATAQAVRGLPGVTLEVGQDMTFLYLVLDAAGRSGNKALEDVRVRKALFQAIDREAIRVNLTRAGAEAPALQRICFASQIACPDGGNPPAYDPEAARKLLAEAGYPDGFDLVVTTTPATQQIADAVVGYLRAVGVRATVKSETIGAYRKSRAEGSQQMVSMFFTHAGMPDAGYSLSFFFADPKVDYSGTPRLPELSVLANSTTGDERAKLMREAYDLLDELAYMLPISANPTLIAHGERVRIDRTDKGAMLNPYGITVANIRKAD